MSDGEQKKRRGRPRVSDEDRRHNTLTCRVRDDVRDAVDEVANATGRTISEQIEYYIECGLKEDARLRYEYSSDDRLENLSKYVGNKLEEDKNIPRGRILSYNNPMDKDAYYEGISREYRRLRRQMLDEMRSDMNNMHDELNASLRNSFSELLKEFRSGLSIYAKTIWFLGGKKAPLLEVEKAILSDPNSINKVDDK